MHRDDDHEVPAVPPQGSGYPASELARALARAARDGEPSAWARVRRWIAVVTGISDGSISVGSRQPVAGLPAWVTLEVVKGGFATGGAVAGGALCAHERLLLHELGLKATHGARGVLNDWFVSQAGLRRLGAAIASGCYEIDVPEAAALPVFAWLVSRGHADEANALRAVLRPHWTTLRFYPRLTATPQARGEEISLEDVGTTIRRLAQMPVQPQVLAQREAVEVWTPLYDRLVALFLETVVGDAPSARKHADGTWQHGDGRSFVVEGGWPCSQYPVGWHDRADALLADFRAARAAHRRCGKARRPKEVLAMLATSLSTLLEQPQALDGRQVGRIRLALARYVAVRGVPTGSVARAQRQAQWPHATAPTHQEVARHVAGHRMAGLSAGDGIDDLTPLVTDVAPGESDDGALRRGAPVPASVVRRMQRCTRGTVEALVERGLVPSAEVLAELLPSRAAALRAADVPDAALRALMTAHGRAFSRRRSLLLLHLQRQVRVEELPWVNSVAPYRRHDPAVAAAAQRAVGSLCALALDAFPHTMLPNKLVRALDGLAQTAQLPLTLTEELAADIFQGRFTAKFAQAARDASQRLAGSLYATYYGLDEPATVQALSSAEPGSAADARAFAMLCARRAGVADGEWGPPSNGRIIEQQMILTTHNLAALAALPDVLQLLDSCRYALARRCFDRIVESLRRPAASRRAELHRVKNAAYAWRQMVFFLGADRDAATAFLHWADERLGTEPDARPSKLRRALNGLRRAAGLDETGPEDAVPVFTGWVQGRHWLMDAPPPAAR